MSVKQTPKTAALFRGGLAKHGSVEQEVVVQVFRKESSEPGMKYRDAVDEALCAGWIDVARQSHDEESYSVQFAPRRPQSLWSGINLKRYQELMAQGRVTARGETAWCERDPESASRYSVERKPTSLPADFLMEFRKHPVAWAYYQRTTPGYRRSSTSWVLGAKRDATRRRRLQVVIDAAAERKYIPLLRG
jgi:uncharacterized protein YdeI (YjbR/CyaY-like superfamily)